MSFEVFDMTFFLEIGVAMQQSKQVTSLVNKTWTLWKTTRFLLITKYDLRLLITIKKKNFWRGKTE